MSENPEVITELAKQANNVAIAVKDLEIVVKKLIVVLETISKKLGDPSGSPP
jgi:hypothetical protein